MPWNKNSDAKRHTHRAKSAKRQRQWRHIANSMLERGESEGAAIRAANGVIRKQTGKRKHKRQAHRRTSR